MTDNGEAAKLVEGAYKNILEKFNPSARQLIAAGKTYVKSLHGVVSASKAYIEALNKVARHAQQGTWGGCADIGTALMQMVDVQKEMEVRKLNTLKAIYVDFLVPLETSIDKDMKVMANEHKKFSQQHKCLQGSFLKAAATVRKQRRKNKGSRGRNLEKELKNLQIFEEEKAKLNYFSECSVQQAIIQERRRFGFILERQCSLAKQHLIFYSQGQSILQHRLSEWEEVAKSREYLPEPIDKLFPYDGDFEGCNDFKSGAVDMTNYSLGLHGGGLLRKTRSIDTSFMDTRASANDDHHKSLIRAKSEFNLPSSSAIFAPNECVEYRKCSARPKSFAGSEPGNGRHAVRAVFSFASCGDHQLSFNEDDLITLIGSRNKGWQYGENQRTHQCGWFPITYTEPCSGDTGIDDSFNDSNSIQKFSSLPRICPTIHLPPPPPPLPPMPL